MLSATSPAVRIASGAATVPDGNGNNLFGGNTLEGFVLDQNQYKFTDRNFVPALATAAQFGATTVNYAFNQPVTATSLPANVGTTREALNEIGLFRWDDGPHDDPVHHRRKPLCAERRGVTPAIQPQQ